MSSLLPATLPLPALFLFVFAFMALRAAVIAGGAIALVTRNARALGRRVYRRAWAPGQLRSEARAATLVVLFDAVVIALARKAGVVRFAPASLGAVAFTFALLFVWYEVWFYFSHRLLHTRALYFIHAQHHVARVTDPLTSLSFSLGERAILQLGAVGFAAAASRVVPITEAGLAGYFLANYVLNVVGHSNVELFRPGFGRRRLGRAVISVTFHAMHHARYTGHYGLFTPVLDRLCGTYFEDYPEVQSRAAQGEGLAKLGERVGPPRER